MITRSIACVVRTSAGATAVSTPTGQSALRRGIWRRSERCNLTTNAGPIPSGAFTRNELTRIQSYLKPVPNIDPSLAPPHTVQYSRPPSEAAVLIPLMNIEGEPHILMEVRSKDMRVHAGEISFPGGKADPEDATFVDTALREAREELGLPSDNVEILGMLHPTEYSLGNKARVWPFVGFIHSTTDYDKADISDPTLPLPSLPISSLTPSPDEVSALLPLPLSALGSDRQTIHYFRLNPNKPYWKIQAGDQLLDPGDRGKKLGMGKDELEVWGLSGWFLNRLSWDLGWMDRPQVTELDD